MNPNRFGLAPPTVDAIGGVLAGHPRVERAVLYGSRAKGTYKIGSDIDLTLEGSGLGHRELLAILGELDDLLLPYTIDLSLASDLHDPGLIDHIRRVGIAFYERAPVDVSH